MSLFIRRWPVDSFSSATRTGAETLMTLMASFGRLQVCSLFKEKGACFQIFQFDFQKAGLSCEALYSILATAKRERQTAMTTNKCKGDCAITRTRNSSKSYFERVNYLFKLPLPIPNDLTYLFVPLTSPKTKQKFTKMKNSLFGSKLVLRNDVNSSGS